MSAEPQWNVITHKQRPVRALPPKADPDSDRARVLVAIALASIAAGAINFAAGATVGSSTAKTLAFFVVVAAAQVAWAAVALVRAPRWWLAAGAAGNVVVVVTWVVSRTIGLPGGVYGGATLPVGFPDALATVLEVLIVVGAVALLARGRGPARSFALSPGVTVATALVAGALGLGGVLGQASAFNSSPAGPTSNGPGVTGPAYPGTSGGGTSGGGTSGGGTSGGGTSGGGTSGGGAYGY